MPDQDPPCPGPAPEHYDLLVIGGGVNGAGIARDAAGRGYAVCLCEQGDFGGGTSSASTKLFHGGLRYLEYLEFRLVREALIEREVLLRAMPHISWPLRFVLPYHAAMRFDTATPVSRLLSVLMPWQRGRRPAWLVRLGLALYDRLGRREILPPTRNLDLTADAAGRPLKPEFRRAFEYSDCWVDDARLVILNLRDAQARGARIDARSTVLRAVYDQQHWQVDIRDADGQTRRVTAAVIVNSAGPWVDQVLHNVFGQNDVHNIRLVRGSHIVVPRKFDHDRAYFFQNADGRIIFAIPYESDYTLIGTTDMDHPELATKPEITAEERDYLCRMASIYFREPVRPEDIVWTYSGLRPLFDDGASGATEATRDYVVRPDPALGNGRLLNIFGGKLTTYRRLAEAVLDQVEDILGRRGPAWTATAHLPGGDLPVDQVDGLIGKVAADYPWLDEFTARRLVRSYGTEVPLVLGPPGSAPAEGETFGAGLTAAEVHHLITREWARSAQDIAFRRTKLGLRLNEDQIARLDAYVAQVLADPEPRPAQTAREH